jgi:hypothetical protein
MKQVLSKTVLITRKRNTVDIMGGTNDVTLNVVNLNE